MNGNDITIHGYLRSDQTASVQAEQGFAWNGPICWRCNTPYLGYHECDVEAAPCPDDKPGCRVNHWRHK
jgi:hypothetical protein